MIEELEEEINSNHQEHISDGTLHECGLLCDNPTHCVPKLKIIKSGSESEFEEELGDATKIHHINTHVINNEIVWLAVVEHVTEHCYCWKACKECVPSYEEHFEEQSDTADGLIKACKHDLMIHNKTLADTTHNKHVKQIKKKYAKLLRKEGIDKGTIARKLHVSPNTLAGWI
jgi:hypothetical protein